MSGHVGQLLVQEAPEEELVRHRVDVREAGQVADDRADARAPPAPGRQQPPRRVAGRAPRARPRAPARACRGGGGRTPTAAASGSAPAPPPAAARPRRRCGEHGRGSRLAVALQPRPAELGQAPVRGLVLGAGIAVAELAGEVEAQPLGAARAVSATASGWSRKRSPPRPGESRTEAELPRRAPSVSSRVAPSRTATSASWSGSRERSWAWTSPVATHGTPSRSRERGEPAVAGPVAAPERPLQLDPEAIAAEGRRAGAAPPPRPRADPRAPSVPPPRPRRAHPERQTSPSACRSSSSNGSDGRQRLARPLASRVPRAPP